MSYKEVAVCIQIRDGNTRLPGKGTLWLDDKPVYEHLMKNVGRCISFINKHSEKKFIKAKCYFLVPFGEYLEWEALSDSTLKKYDITVVGGSPIDDSDVFYRFDRVFKSFKPNYIIRITGDCPFLPSALINKAVNCAITHKLDYISNVEERFRTMPDGFDVEVLSDEAFLWLSRKLETHGQPGHKEHVTTYLRENAPSWMRRAVLTGTFDLSDQKYSLDTKEDFKLLLAKASSKRVKDAAARKEGLGVYEY